MKLKLITACLMVSALICSIAAPVVAQTTSQVRLADDLDMPGDGYCIDVLGVGATARADLPLVAHNCLASRGAVDRVAVFEGNRIYMPRFDACVTAFGVVRPLPGSPAILRPCGARESFLPVNTLQRFERDRGRLRLSGSTLCLAVGLDAAATFSAAHRWRTLSLEDCDTIPDVLAIWQ